MTDLVERARNRNMPYGWSELMDKMADEIERLRKELRVAINCNEKATNEIEQLRVLVISQDTIIDKQKAMLERLQQAYDNRGAEMDNMREVLATTQDWNEKALAPEIERLKERNSVLEIAHRQTQKTLGSAYRKIERLEAGNTELLKAHDEACAEIERLREQLRLYGSWPSTPEAKP